MKSRPTLSSRALATTAAVIVLATTATLPLHAEKPDVRAKIIVPASAPAGAKSTLAVELTLGPQWHVNSHTPSETFLIPTDLSLTTSAGTLSPVRYPSQVERRFSFSEKPLRVYEGTVRFETDLDLPSTAAGKAAIAGTLSYQACNDRQCFAPAKIPLDATIGISSPSGPTQPLVQFRNRDGTNAPLRMARWLLRGRGPIYPSEWTH